MKNMHPDDIVHLNETTDISNELEKLMVVAALRFVEYSEFHGGLARVYSDILDNLENALATLTSPREAGNYRVCVLGAAAAIVVRD
jgi:hypothetical protein